MWVRIMLNIGNVPITTMYQSLLGGKMAIELLRGVAY